MRTLRAAFMCAGLVLFFGTSAGAQQDLPVVGATPAPTSAAITSSLTTSTPTTAGTASTFAQTTMDGSTSALSSSIGTQVQNWVNQSCIPSATAAPGTATGIDGVLNNLSNPQSMGGSTQGSTISSFGFYVGNWIALTLMGFSILLWFRKHIGDLMNGNVFAALLAVEAKFFAMAVVLLGIQFAAGQGMFAGNNGTAISVMSTTVANIADGAATYLGNPGDTSTTSPNSTAITTPGQAYSVSICLGAKVEMVPILSALASAQTQAQGRAWFDVWGKAADAVSGASDAVETGLFGLFNVLLIIFMGLALALQLFLIQWGAVIIGGIGILFLGFEMLERTRPLADGYWKYVQGNLVGTFTINIVCVFTTALLNNVLRGIANDALAPALNPLSMPISIPGMPMTSIPGVAMSGILPDIKICFIVMFCLALVIAIPRITSSFLSGSSPLAMGDLVGAAMTVGGTAAAIAGGMASVAKGLQSFMSALKENQFGKGSIGEGKPETSQNEISATKANLGDTQPDMHAAPSADEAMGEFGAEGMADDLADDDSADADAGAESPAQTREPAQPEESETATQPPVLAGAEGTSAEALGAEAASALGSRVSPSARRRQRARSATAKRSERSGSAQVGEASDASTTMPPLDPQTAEAAQAALTGAAAAVVAAASGASGESPAPALTQPLMDLAAANTALAGSIAETNLALAGASPGALSDAGFVERSAMQSSAHALAQAATTTAQAASSPSASPAVAQHAAQATSAIAAASAAVATEGMTAGTAAKMEAAHGAVVQLANASFVAGDNASVVSLAGAADGLKVQAQTARSVAAVVSTAATSGTAGARTGGTRAGTPQGGGAMSAAAPSPLAPADGATASGAPSASGPSSETVTSNAPTSAGAPPPTAPAGPAPAGPAPAAGAPPPPILSPDQQKDFVSLMERAFGPVVESNAKLAAGLENTAAIIERDGKRQATPAAAAKRSSFYERMRIAQMAGLGINRIVTDHHHSGAPGLTPHSHS